MRVLRGVECGSHAAATAVLTIRFVAGVDPAGDEDTVGLVTITESVSNKLR
jgi:hypothetical protein